QAGDAAVGIVQVAEHNRVRRTRLLARGQDLAVANPPVLRLRPDAGGIDPLHAVGAFLHDTAAADGDVGVPRQLQAGRVPVLIEEVVEAAHLVGTVVRAVAG